MRIELDLGGRDEERGGGGSSGGRAAARGCILIYVQRVVPTHGIPARSVNFCFEA